MPIQFSRADSLREYLTGALVDGGIQTNPNLALGGYRSLTEAVSLGIVIANPISGVMPLYASGGNPVGAGTLMAVDSNNLTWQPFGAPSPGAPTSFSGTNDIEIVEANGQPGQYLRVQGTTPFVPGSSTITLSYLANNLFGFDNVSISAAISGGNEYRVTILRNEGAFAISAFQRWLTLLGVQQTSNNGFLPATGPGSITTSGSFASWPVTGWCQVRSSGGTLKEIVYYSSRSNTSLSVPGVDRGLLGTSFAAGSSTDVVYPVAGAGIGFDPSGVQNFGSGIQQVANVTTAPAGVTWNFGVSAVAGLQLANLPASQQMAIWIWRQIPAGAIATPLALQSFSDSFNAF